MWPIYRKAITLAPGATKAISTVVLEAPYGYRAELRDRVGRMIAEQTAPSTGVVRRNRWAICLLGRSTDSEVIRRGVPGNDVLSGMQVSRSSTGGDLPDDAVGLSGLQVMVVNDFDASALNPRQRAAIRDFVGQGGSLVLGGGSTGAGTLGSLPPELVPLRPTGTASASMAPLSPTAAAFTSSATVITGQLAFGRVVLQGEGAPPLVVDAEYGLGRIVQLAFDPFAEPFASDFALAAAGLGAGMGPALESRGPGGFGPDSADLWSPVLDGTAGDSAPNWPGWSIGLLGGYLLLVAPAGYLGLRSSRRRDLVWAIGPLALILAAIMVIARPDPGPDRTSFGSRLEVHTIGPHGAVLVNRYYGLGASSVFPIPEATAVSSVIAEPVPSRGNDPGSDRITNSVAFAQPRSGVRGGNLPPGALDPSAAAEVSTDAAGEVELRLPPAPAREVRTMQTLSVEHDRGELEAELRLSGSADTGDRRITGTVTNNTGRRLGSLSFVATLRPWIAERLEADLVGTLEPGTSAAIDQPLSVAGDMAGGSKADPTKRLLSAAAHLAGPPTDLGLLMALAEPAGNGKAIDAGSRTVVFLKVVPVER
ncbi:MAG: hypothetical protein ABIY58_13350 [Acidimicrobiales bacterium]